MLKSSYYDHPALSQSYLKGLVGKPFDSKSILGSVVDVLATEEDKFADNFVIGPKVPFSLAELFVKAYEFGEVNIDNVLRANVSIQYGKGKYTKDFFEKKIEENIEYINLIGTKTIIDQDLFDGAMKMVNAVWDYWPELQGYDKQVELYGKVNEFDAKCRIDFLSDEVIDLKTIFDIEEIERNFWKYRYDFQMAWYTALARKKKASLIFVSPEGYVKKVTVHPDTLRIGKEGGYRKVEERNSGYVRHSYIYGYEDILKNLKFLEAYKGHRNYNFIFKELFL